MSANPQVFTDNEIVPQILREAPPHIMSIVFENNIEANLGNEITPSQTANIPISVSWPVDSSKEELYTILFLDPDAPSREHPKYRSAVHWVCVNIPNCNINQGVHLAIYQGPGPPGNTLHRYLFAVYKQERPVDVTNRKLYFGMLNRLSKSFDGILENLIALGGPNTFTIVAANWFSAKYEPYVLARMRRMLGLCGCCAPFMLWIMQKQT